MFPNNPYAFLSGTNLQNARCNDKNKNKIKIKNKRKSEVLFV
jgi:hypothetical protein